jgi:hypothetical protein
MLRKVCSLGPSIKSLCETGCIYREASLRHLACPVSIKTEACVAPCTPTPCPCRKTDLILHPKATAPNEVRTL